MGVRVGIGIASFGFDAPRDWFRFAERCEAGGVDSLWQTDRLIGTEPTLESMTAMAALAGATERIKFGMNAVVVTLRDPLVLAKQCATIDYLSNGRLLPVFGVGFEGAPEWEATGRDPGGRGRRANEALTIMRQLWDEGSSSFEGEFHRTVDATIAPRPTQRPLPCWIGGHSKAAIRRTARIGTGWLGGILPPEQVGPVIRAIRAEASDAGRHIDPDHFGASVPFRFGGADDPLVQRFGRATKRAGGPSALVTGTPADLVAHCERLIEAGASKFVLLPVARGTRDLDDQVERAIAEVVPAVEQRD